MRRLRGGASLPGGDSLRPGDRGGPVPLRPGLLLRGAGPRRGAGLEVRQEILAGAGVRRYIAQAAAEELSGGFDAVSFVPVSLRRNFERGFDQARLLAEEAANIWGVKAEAVLRKGRHTRAQSSLQDAALRKANVKGAYRVPHPERVRGRRFLLIDDVCTTGSTLSACADTLMAAGAASVAGGRRGGGCVRRSGRRKPKEREPGGAFSIIW